MNSALRLRRDFPSILPFQSRTAEQNVFTPREQRALRSAHPYPPRASGSTGTETGTTILYTRRDGSCTERRKNSCKRSRRRARKCTRQPDRSVELRRRAARNGGRLSRVLHHGSDLRAPVLRLVQVSTSQGRQGGKLAGGRRDEGLVRVPCSRSQRRTAPLARIVLWTQKKKGEGGLAAATAAERCERRVKNKSKLFFIVELEAVAVCRTTTGGSSSSGGGGAHRRSSCERGARGSGAHRRRRQHCRSAARRRHHSPTHWR